MLSEIICFSRGEVSTWRDVHERPHPTEPNSRVGHQSGAEINLLIRKSSWFCVDPVDPPSHLRGRKCRHFYLSSVLTAKTRTKIHFHFASFNTNLQPSHWNNCPAERTNLAIKENSFICDGFHCGGDPILPVCCSA